MKQAAPPARGGFKLLRILVLLLVLLAVALSTWLDRYRSTRWHEPLYVAIYPIAADEIFVLYHDPALTPRVPHSLGLTKGLIGVVYAFASPDMDGENAVVIAHELLHTVGATDKYLPGSDAPRFPDGYGDPKQVPLYPQRFAEIMAGRRMLAPDRWQQAADLDEVLIGPATALEIRWR